MESWDRERWPVPDMPKWVLALTLLTLLTDHSLRTKECTEVPYLLIIRTNQPIILCPGTPKQAIFITTFLNFPKKIVSKKINFQTVRTLLIWE
jgi:hypothetical protein